MSKEKRPYNSTARQQQAIETKNRIIAAAKSLFQAEGFEMLTIEKLAKAAQVAISTVYALFQSKRGVLRAVMDQALPLEQYHALVEQTKVKQSAQSRMKLAAKITCQLYEAEKTQIDLFRGAPLLSPELKELERERETRRYSRQEETIKTLAQEQALVEGLSLVKARDILWACTGRDLYRLLVVERGWKIEEYENWLAELLVKTLVQEGH